MKLKQILLAVWGVITLIGGTLLALLLRQKETDPEQSLTPTSVPSPPPKHTPTMTPEGVGELTDEELADMFGALADDKRPDNG